MERWQREYITAKRPVLIEFTICNTNFLSILRSKGVLAAVDLDQLDTVRNFSGEMAQRNLMYNIITTRVGAYDVLVQALQECNQTGARNVLMFGYLRQGLFPPFSYAGEIFDWKSVEFSLHDEILSKYVKVQNKKVLLGEFCKKIDSKKVKDIIERTIDKKLIFEILSNKCDFVLIKNTIPDKVEYYIPRTLTKRARLNESILRDNEKDIFVVMGATWNQLTKMTSPNIVDRSSNQLEKLTVRHILGELDEDFDTICSTSCSKDANVHLLNFDTGKLDWMRTHGSIKSLHGYIHENQDKITDNTLIENLKQQQLAQFRAPVCISDSPGMGKTILLTEIANELNETAGDNTLVFFFVLREFVQYLPTKVKDATAEKIMELISTQVTTSNFGKEIVQCLLSTPDQNIELCFDGFDEILESQIEVTKKLLKIIRLEFNNTRLHVTTRPHMRQQLEETLDALGFNILPFEEDDQIKFLVDFWKFTQQLSSDRTAMLQNFAQRCLTTLKEKMVEDEHDIAGVPLQCRLLGEIYQRRVKRMLSGPINDEDDVPLVNSIYQMYHNLMLLRFERATEQQNIRDSAYYGVGKLLRVVAIKKSWVLKVEEVHFIVAVDVLFPELTFTMKNIFPKDHHKYMHSKEIYDLGLIEAKLTFDQNYRFSHRTFAEFLVAKFLVNVLTFKLRVRRRRKDEFWTAFLHHLFFNILNTKTKQDVILEREVSGVYSRVKISTFGNSVIAYFINAHLKNENLTDLDLADIRKYLTCIKIDESLFHSIFIACAASNLEHLFHFMMIAFKTMKQHLFSLPAELLVIAAKYSGLELNRLIHNSFSDKVIVTFNGGSSKGDLVTPSQTVVQRGNQPVLQVLLNRYKGTCISKNLLHICLTGSHFDNMDTIFRKIEIIRLLLEQAPFLCDEKLEEDGTTPILQPYAHLELVQCLLENGADVNAVSKNQENVLHVFLNGGDKYKIEEYVLIELLLLLRKFKFSDYNRVNIKGETPLSLAARAVSLTANSLQIFKDQGTDFSFVNKNQENLLHAAIRSEQSIDCIQQLKIFGVDVNAINSNSETLLHYAVDVGHKKAVELLINEVSILVNASDSNGNRPLHIAFTNNSRMHLQIQDILMENGADIQVLNGDACTPVAYGLESSTNLVINVERLKNIEMRGFNLSSDNADKLLRAILLNQSAASWEFNQEFFGLISFLISIGGRVKCDNGSNPADVNSVKLCLSKICQNVYSNMFGRPVSTEPMNAFHRIGDKILNENRSNLFSGHKLNFQNINIECMMLVLVFLKDRKSFRTLQKAYQLLLIRSNRFIAPLEGLISFLEQDEQQVCVIVTDNIILSVAAVQDTVDSSILVVDMEKNEKMFTDPANPVVVIVPKAALPAFFHTHIYTTSKIICITKCNTLVEIPKNVAFLEHKYKWESLSMRLQNQLLQRFKNQKSSFKYDFQKLFLSDLESSNVFLLDFLVPEHVKNNLKGLFDADVLTKSSEIYDDLQQHMFKQFFPQIKGTFTNYYLHDSQEVCDKLKELGQHGPTATYLVALWIFRNISTVFESDETFFDQLFTSDQMNLTVMNPGTKDMTYIITYEFKQWLLLYFLDKLASLSSLKNIIPIKPNYNEILLHCCINLNAPNLLKLFDHRFQLSLDTLPVAAIRGNVHVFDKENTKLKDLTYKYVQEHSAIFFVASFYMSVKQVYLSDIQCFMECIEIVPRHKNLCKDIIQLCVDGTFDEESEIIQRKLMVLNNAVRKNLLSAEDLEFSTKILHKVHPEFIKFLIINLAKINPDARLPDKYVDNLLAYLSTRQFGEIIRFILENQFQHLLERSDMSMVPLFCKALRSLDEKDKSLFELLPTVLTNQDISWYLKNSTLCKREKHVLEIILKYFKNYTVNRNELHIAITSGHVEAVKFFILHGASVNNLCECCDQIPLHLSITASGYVPEIFSTLLHFGACPTHDIVTLLSKHLSPKHYQATIKRLLDKDWGKIFEPTFLIDSSRLELEHGLYHFEISTATISQLVRAVDYDGKLANCIYCSAIERNRGVVELKYIKKWLGGDLSKICSHKLTPLHTAAKFGNIEATEYLLNSGFYVNVKCKCCKSTPLHWCFKGNLDGAIIETMVSLLLKHGADVNKRNTRSISVYEQALTLHEIQKLPNHVLKRMSKKAKGPKK